MISLASLVLSAATFAVELPPGPLKNATYEWEPRRSNTGDTNDFLEENFIVPEGVYVLIATGCGGGGGGGGGGTVGGGGGEGAPLVSYTIPTQPGATLRIRVGKGGAGGIVKKGRRWLDEGRNGAPGTETSIGSWVFPRGLGGRGAYMIETGFAAGGRGSHHQGIAGGRGGGPKTGSRAEIRAASAGEPGINRVDPITGHEQTGGLRGGYQDRGYYSGGGGGAGVDGPGGDGGKAEEGRANRGKNGTGHCSGGGGGASKDEDGHLGPGGSGAGGWLQIWYLDVVAEREFQEQLIQEVVSKLEQEAVDRAQEAQEERLKEQAVDEYHELVGDTVREGQ